MPGEGPDKAQGAFLFFYLQLPMVGAETWGTENSSPESRKPLALRLKTGGLQAASDPLTYLLGLESV